MKKMVISFVLVISLLMQCVPVSALSLDAEGSDVLQMLTRAVYNQDEFVEAIDDVIKSDDISNYTDGIEITTDMSPVLQGGVDDSQPTAVMHDDTLHVSVDALDEVFDCEVIQNEEDNSAFITHDGTTTVVSTQAVETADGEIQGVVIDDETYASVSDIADVMGYQLASDVTQERVMLVDKFQTKRLFVQLKDIAMLTDDAIVTAFSDVKDIAVNKDGLIFAGFDTESAAEKTYNLLASNADVEYVEVDNIIEISYGAVGNYTWGTDFCNAYNFAMQDPSVSSTDKQVTVAVIDSGLNSQDPIFDGRVVYDGTTQLNNDSIGHGTHVAGIIAAFTQAVADNVKICPYRIETASDGTFDYTTTANMYTVVNRAAKHDVINMSFVIQPLSVYTTLKNAINSAKSAVLVAGAGNDAVAVVSDSLAGNVAAMSNGIVVTAIDRNSSPATFTNYASVYTNSYIAAPGVGVKSTYYVNGFNYYFLDGTSMATPHVAGACAILALTDENITSSEIKSLLFNQHCKTPPNWNQRYGMGVLSMSNFYSGTMDNGMEWSLINGVLSIKGNGVLPDVDDDDKVSWSRHMNNITSVNLTGNIDNISLKNLGTLPMLKEINISQDNSRYLSENGVVYTIDRKTLVAYPPCAKGGEVIIPETVTAIGDNAFLACSKLSSVVISKNVTSIGKNAFYNCVNLADIYYTGTEQSWDAISKPDGWNHNAGKECYDKQCNITFGYTMPDYYGECGDYAVWKLRTDEKLLIIEGMGAIYDFDTIAENGFITGTTAGWSPYSQYIDNLLIKNGITTIGKNAFCNCGSVEDIVLADTVTTVKPGAFDYTLNSVTLSACFENYDVKLFNGCYNLKNVYVDEENPYFSSVDGVLFNKDQTELVYYPYYKIDKEYVMPEGVKKIGDMAFYDHRYVKNVVFCDGLEEIGTGAFMAAAISELNLPVGVTTIGDSAFEDCFFLSSVSLPHGVKVIGNKAFKDANYIETMQFPATLEKIGADIIMNCGVDLLFFMGTKEQWDAVDKDEDWNLGRKDIIVQFEVDLPLDGIYDSGSCGGKADWYYWNDEATLLITGTGTIDFRKTLFETYGKSVKKVIISDGITEIGETFFYYFTNLTDVTIPSSVTKIGDDAFSMCSSIEELVIPDSVTEIGQGAFSAMSKLKSIKLPSGLSTIKWQLLSGSSALETVILPETVTTIEDQAFYGCKGLKTIKIPSGVTEIMKYTFYNCTSLEEIQLGNNITIIGEGAFEKCSSLRSFTVPDGVEQIAKSTFSGCTLLEDIIFGDSLKAIDDGAFKNCTSLKTPVLPKNLESLSPIAFEGCNFEEYIVHAENTNFATSKGVLYNHDYTTLIAYPMAKQGSEYVVLNTATQIGTRAFYGAANLEKVTMPASVAEIAAYAFYNAKKLARVDGGTVTTIGDYAFYECNELKTVELPDCVTNIGNNAFYNCSSFEGIGLQPALKTIGSYAFYNCSALTELTIFASVEAIGDSAFYKCSGIKNILIYKGDITVGSNAFYYGLDSLETVYYTGVRQEFNNSGYRFSSSNVTSPIIAYRYNPELGYCCDTYADNFSWIFYPQTGVLEVNGSGALPDVEKSSETTWYDNIQIINKVVIGNGITSIGSNIFAGYSRLNTVELPDGLMSIGNQAFKSSGVVKISLPDSVATIGDSAFSSCTMLAEAQLSKNLKTMGTDVFSSCYKLTSVLFNGGVEVIPENTFKSCFQLNSVVMTDGTMTIGKSAFEGCSDLVEVVMPDSIEHIESRAFYGCSAAKISKLPDELKTIGDEVFYNCTSIELLIMNNKIESIGQKSLFNTGNYGNVYYKGTMAQWKAVKYTAGGNFAKVCCYFDGVNYPDYFGNDTGNTMFWHVYKDSSTLKLFANGNMSYSTYGYNSYASNIKNVVLDDSVTNLPSNAFTNLNYVESFTAGKNLVSLDTDVFKECTGLKTVDLKNTDIKTIPNYTFYNCTALTTVLLPDGLTSINSGAFCGCKSLKSLELPESLTYIGKDAFNSCTSLADIKIPANVTTIMNMAFNNCSSITELELPAGLTEISNSAFRYCVKLQKINLPDGIVSIGNDAFLNCASLKEIVIPDGVKTIGSSAFESCGALVSITIPTSVESIAKDSFYYCSRLTYYYKGNREQWLNIANIDSINISKVVFGENSDGGTGDADGVQWEFDSATGTLNIYGTGAMSDFESADTTPWYYYATQITAVNIGADVTYIGNYAFNGCTGINTVTVDAQNTELVVEDNVLFDKTPYKLLFYPLTKIDTQYTVPQGVTEIAPAAFENNTRIQKVILPESLTKLGKNIFNKCSNLTTVYIPKSVTTIESLCFANRHPHLRIFYQGSTDEWQSIAKASAWGSAMSICYYSDANNLCTDFGVYEESTFWQYYNNNKTLIIYTDGDIAELADNSYFPWATYRESVANVVMYGTTTNIPGKCFMNYVSLAEITLPDTIRTIGNNAFDGCTSLREIPLTNDITSIGSMAFNNCSSLLSVNITDKITSIADGAFSGCTSLTEIDIPESVTSIGDNAFYGCANIAQFVIPKTVTSIGNNAFKGCSAVSTMYIHENVSAIGTYAFAGMTRLTDIEIPIQNFDIPDGLVSGCTSLTTFKHATLKSIGNSAFSDCSSLTDAGNLEGVTSIGESAFKNCEKLANINIPDGICEIPKSAFDGCTALTEIVLPQSVTKIWAYAFKNCKSLQTLVIPKSVTTIEQYFYIGARGVLSVYYEGSEEDFALVYDSPNLVSPTFTVYYNYDAANQSLGGSCGDGVNWVMNLGTKTLKIFGNGIIKDYQSVSPWTAFASNIQTVEIMDGVSSIGEYAFYNLTALEHIIFPGTKIDINRYAFYNCSGLKKLVLPANVGVVEYSAFYGCNGIEEIVIYSGVGEIDSLSFKNTKTLRAVYYTGSMEELNSNNRSFASSFDEKLVYGYDVDTGISRGNVGTDMSWAFDINSGEIVFSGSGDMPSIGYDGTPWGSLSLIKSVKISKGITSIASNAFRSYTELQKVFVSDTVTHIDSTAFYDCKNLAIIEYSGTEAKWNAINKGFYWDRNMGSNVDGGTVVVYNVAEPEIVEVKELKLSYGPQGVTVNASSALGDYSGVFVVALYNGSELAHCVIGDADKQYSTLLSADGNRVKVMWIKDIETLMPLCSVAELEIP